MEGKKGSLARRKELSSSSERASFRGILRARFNNNCGLCNLHRIEVQALCHPRRKELLLRHSSLAFRLKDALCTSQDLAGSDDEEPAAPRKRSNSMPIPQIEVTSCNTGATDNAEDGKAKKNGLTANVGDDDDDVMSAAESAFHARATSLGGKRRKKSIIGQGLEVTRLKHFKSFVESKILSKSDRSLAGGDESDGKPSPQPPPSPTVRRGSSGFANTALVAKDYFKRRCSRTSINVLAADAVTESSPAAPPATPTPVRDKSNCPLFFDGAILNAHSRAFLS